jgi:hypothetical protein
MPVFAPNSFLPLKPLALGGCGTERAVVAPGVPMFAVPRAPAFAEKFPIGRCAPGLIWGEAMWLTIGREKVLAGGLEANRPAFAPSVVVRVGVTFNERKGVSRLIWFGERRMLLRATGSEFTRVLRETAVNPLRAFRFA